MSLKVKVKNLVRPLFYFAMNPRVKRLCKSTEHRLENYRNKHMGERCFIIGNGPSLNKEDLEKLDSEITFACNRIYVMFDNLKWRPTYYSCQDPTIIRSCINEINNQKKLIKFIKPTGEKKYDINDAIYFNVNYSFSKNRKKPPFSDNMRLGIYDGLSVVYSQMQIAAYMGFKEIYLIGVDCNYSIDNRTINENSYPDKRMYEPKKVGMPPDFEYTFKAYYSAKEYCKEKGIVIKNATRGGKLEVFDRVNLDDILGK